MLGEVTNKFSHKSLLILLGRMSRRLKTECFVILQQTQRFMTERCVWTVLSARCWLCHLLLAGGSFEWWLGQSAGQGLLVCCVTHVLLAGTNHWGTAGQLFVAADRYRQTPALCVQAVRKDLNLTLSLVCHQEE